jgi:recombination protein RecA
LPRVKIEETFSDREAAFAALEKKYKDIKHPPTVEPAKPEDILHFPGLSLNLLCGADHGIRKGSIVHWWGKPGALKTTIALSMARQAQLKWPDKTVAYIDTECRVDLYNASKILGLETEAYDTGVPRLIYRRPETGEEAWEIIAALAATGFVSLIVLDSGTAMRSKSVVENPDFSTGQVGMAARINSAAFNKYAPLFPSTGTILWGINQERIVSIQPIVQIGPTGGGAWEFYDTHEFHVKRVSKTQESLHQDLVIRSEKIKWGPSQRTIEVPILLGQGIKAEADIIRVAEEAKVVDKNGTWYAYQGVNIGQGEDKAAQYLKENPNLKEEIISQVYELAAD